MLLFIVFIHYVTHTFPKTVHTTLQDSFYKGGGDITTTCRQEKKLSLFLNNLIPNDLEPRMMWARLVYISVSTYIWMLFVQLFPAPRHTAQRQATAPPNVAPCHAAPRCAALQISANVASLGLLMLGLHYVPGGYGGHVCPKCSAPSIPFSPRWPETWPPWPPGT